MRLHWIRTATVFALIVFSFPQTGFCKKSPEKAAAALKSAWKDCEKEKFDAALEKFNKALRFDKKSAAAYFGLGYVYSTQNNLELGNKNYRKSLRYAPEHSPTYSNVGLNLLYLKKFEEGYAMLEKAIELDEKNGDAYVNLAYYYFLRGNYLKAWENIREAEKWKTDINREFLLDLNSRMADPGNSARH